MNSIYAMRLLVVLVGLINSGSAVSCKQNNSNSLLCDGVKVFEKLINADSPLVVFPGLEIVRVKNATLADTGRSNSADGENSSFVGKIADYLKKHEINIKLSEIMDKNEFRGILNNFDSGKDVTTGRKKDKGYGIILAMGLMMAKMLGVLGIGGIGVMAMKALGASALALLLSGILGIKGLQSGHEENAHHVQYIHDGHRRRRSLPYRRWKM